MIVTQGLQPHHWIYDTLTDSQLDGIIGSNGNLGN